MAAKARVKQASAERDAAWAIQLASFASRGDANQAIARATRALPGLKSAQSKVDMARVGKRNVYKARMIGVSEDVARTACAKLKAMAACSVMPAAGFTQSASIPG